MLRYRAEIGLLRALVFFLAGVIAGVQIALYLFDLYDDGVGDARSGLIGVALLIVGAGFVMWSYRSSGGKRGR